MIINFENTSYEEAVSNLTRKMTFAMTCSIGFGANKRFDEVIESDEIKDKRFLKATIMDCQSQIPNLFNFFMYVVPTLKFIAEVSARSKNKVFYICY